MMDTLVGLVAAYKSRIAALEAEVERLSGAGDKCKWTEDEWDGYCETACGQAFEFTDGGPAENHCRFCHVCGKPIEVVAAVEKTCYTCFHYVYQEAGVAGATIGMGFGCSLGVENVLESVGCERWKNEEDEPEDDA